MKLITLSLVRKIIYSSHRKHEAKKIWSLGHLKSPHSSDRTPNQFFGGHGFESKTISLSHTCSVMDQKQTFDVAARGILEVKADEGVHQRKVQTGLILEQLCQTACELLQSEVPSATEVIDHHLI